MFRRKNTQPELEADLTAEDKRGAALTQMVMATQAVIHFKTDGTILFANQNFLDAMGFEDLDEIVDKKHALFVDPDYAASEEYAEFWRILRGGKAHSGTFERFRKNGQSIWIDATYAPVFDEEGEVERIIKVASDVTDRQQISILLNEGMANLLNGILKHATYPEDYEEVRRIGTEFNQMISSFTGFVQTVGNTSSNVDTVAKNLRHSSNEIARRGESQAASLEEVAAAINELSATAAMSLDRAKENVELTKSSKSSAEDGRRVVDGVVNAMNGIEDSSSQIARVLGVIDEIAFQTNLLALNAGVEAARAGEAGRGFAVVASEVRSLAQRSSEAATEIKSLVQTSNERVRNGSTLVGQAGDVLERVFEEIGTISDNVESSLGTIDEQTRTIAEINSATTQLSQDTEHNAALTKDMADMSNQLASAAGELIEEVQQFQVVDGEAETIEQPLAKAS